MEDEEEDAINESTEGINPHGVDLDALPERSSHSEISWLDLNGLTAKEALGISFERSFAKIREST